MPFPVEMYCECGAKAKYTFQVEASYDQFKELWAREHDGEGHRQVFKGEYQQIMAQRRNGL